MSRIGLVQELADARTTAERVRARRESAGLTQQTLATRAGIATKTLARIERGEDTTVGTLRAIADVLDLEVGSLIGADA